MSSADLSMMTSSEQRERKMDTIKNYLENMFMNMPKTDKVLKAKVELGQMMEDKYNELIKEGKSDNEAVGIVISEFGNIKEIAGDLGIDDQVTMKNTAAENARPVSMEEARTYISDTIHASIEIGIAVFMFITASAAWLLFENVGRVLAPVMFFGMIACGVGLCIFEGVCNSKWSFVEHERVQLDFETADYVRNQRDNFNMQRAAFMTIGVMLIVLSFVPSAVLDNTIYANTANASLFVMIGIGVMMLIMAGMRNDAYKRLLNDTAKDQFDMHSQENRMNRTGKKVIAVFWPTVTCIYFCWSFLTFNWGITWIIWPIAAAVKMLIVAIFSQPED